MICINKYIIRPAPSFEKELEKIFNYIAFNLKEPLTAKNFYNQVSKEIYSLQYFPERYMKLPIGINSKRNLRRLPFTKYAIIYEIDNISRPGIYFTYFS